MNNMVMENMLSVVIGVILLIWIIVIYNAIIGKYNRAKRAWSDVIAYERLKNDVLPQLEKMLGEYKEFESGLLKRITELRGALSSLDEGNIDASRLVEVESRSRQLMQGIKLTMENYPDLKTQHVVQQVMQEISEKNANVAAAITIFNRSVELFNDKIQYFPNSLVNAILNRKKTITPFDDTEASAGIEYQPDF
ncbi:MAG: LemA family protein [Mariprofundaceae bacterium]|nr:LemA family protein [Mariprofundaceae bacterium]